MERCNRCSDVLTAGFEINISTCLPCVRKIVATAAATDETISALRHKLKTKTESEEMYRSAAEVHRNVREARLLGSMARTRGMKLSDNPFSSQLNEANEWELGWIIEDVPLQMAELQRVNRSAVSVLLLVRDLVLGQADPTEIVSKLDDVISVFGQNVPEVAEAATEQR